MIAVANPKRLVSKHSLLRTMNPFRGARVRGRQMQRDQSKAPTIVKVWYPCVALMRWVGVRREIC